MPSPSAELAPPRERPPQPGTPPRRPPRRRRDPLVPSHFRRTWEPAHGLGWVLVVALLRRHRRRVILGLALLLSAVLLATTAMPLVTRTAWRQGGWPLQRVGMDGPAVRSVQYLLLARGHRLSVDGVFGSETRQSVIDFQRARGLRVDGIVGPQTWSSLVVPMRRGVQGNSVRAIQSQLNARGIPTTVDGVFGPQTEQNVIAFQRARDLEASGIVGPVTWNALITPRSAWQGPVAPTPANPPAGEETPPPTLPETP